MDVTEELRQITAPTLVIAGARDRLAPPKTARAVSDQIAGSRFVVLPRAGHVLMYDRPEEFNRLVLGFLQ
jgi:pimeloyl-ACP methyl ester carboxylesterase